MARAIFFDRDGVLLKEPRVGSETDNCSDTINCWRKFEPSVGLAPAFNMLAGTDYHLLIITNQDGIEEGYLSQQFYEETNACLVGLIRQATGGRVHIDGIYTCPHSLSSNCVCCKPKRGLINQALSDYPDINIAQSWFVGDRGTDILLGESIGTRTVFIRANHPLPPDIIPDYQTMSLEDAVHYILSIDRVSHPK